MHESSLMTRFSVHAFFLLVTVSLIEKEWTSVLRIHSLHSFPYVFKREERILKVTAIFFHNPFFSGVRTFSHNDEVLGLKVLHGCYWRTCSCNLI